MSKKDLIEYTEDTFKEIENHDGVSVIRFYADWCKPCHEGEPFFDMAVKHMGNAVKVGIVNVLAAPVLTEKYAVWGLPNVLIFSNGQLVKRLSGTLSTAAYLDAVDNVIKTTQKL
ncbi:thioredoxin family protein [Citrobacter telavivensis]